ncbi:MAG: glycosyltransferase family 2 protein [Microgenomates group bacterium]
MKKISVIVTNWNTVNLLKKFFHKVVENSPEASEIIFADDASPDGSVAYIRELQKKYPQIKIIAHKKNLGFGKNSNDAVRRAKGDYVVLLNSDIDPHRGYISHALPHLQDEQVFGVGFCELGNENWSNIFWKDGYLQYNRGVNNGQTHISGWLSGGGSIIDKAKFEKLGGFDNVYAPFYSEDVDLGYRAWKSGYTLLWEPKCIIEHKHESTMSKFPKRHLDYVKERNRLLTVLRNITDPKMLFENKLTQILRVLTGPNYLKIILAAHRQLKLNSPPLVFPVRTDAEIFAMFK